MHYHDKIAFCEGVCNVMRTQWFTRDVHTCRCTCEKGELRLRARPVSKCLFKIQSTVDRGVEFNISITSLKKSSTSPHDIRLTDKLHSIWIYTLICHKWTWYRLLQSDWFAALHTSYDWRVVKIFPAVCEEGQLRIFYNLKCQLIT